MLSASSVLILILIEFFCVVKLLNPKWALPGSPVIALSTRYWNEAPPNEPSGPRAPEVPLEPDVPLEPVVPDEPDVPDVPLEPEVPDEPDVPSLPAIEKDKVISSPLLKGFCAVE